MPSLGFAEIIIILLVALIVFGPKKLPEVGRSLGKSVREFRRATSSLRSEIEDGFDDDEPASGPPRWQAAREAREAREERQRNNGEAPPRPEDVPDPPRDTAEEPADGSGRPTGDGPD
jgi:sec-independent protein translocase protein TatA